MQQDPIYLRNRSRDLHRTYRRNRRFINALAIIWSAAFGALLLAGIVGQLAGLQWVFSSTDLWLFLGFIGGGGVFWLFATLVAKINLRYARHTYGPDPVSEESER